MKTRQKFIVTGIAAAIAGLQGCASTQPPGDELRARIDTLEQEVSARDQRIRELESAPGMAAPVAATAMQAEPLLPPDAKAGECYARVWVEPVYRNVSEEKLVSEASERVEVIPASFEWVEEQVMVAQASTRLEEVPAVYGTEEERVLVSAATRTWRTALGNDSAPASPELLKAATAGGIDLDAATPGMCFHEHYEPARYEDTSQQVLVSEELQSYGIRDAEYRWVEKQVLVSEASTELVEVPAEYGWEEEQVVDKPAHTIWKKGTGPIQRIDEATGEIMCLVEVPATYKTVRKRVLKTPATTRKVEIPAKYETVRVRELVDGPSESRNVTPAAYKTVTGRRKVADATFIWHEVHNREHPKETRTGNRICLTEQPAVYKTITRRVVTSPAGVRSIEIPAEYRMVKVRKLVSPAEEKRIPIPAEYRTVSRTELEKEGFMEWRSILCETNMTGTRISQIQSALQQAGYDPGKIDGVVGQQTMMAVNAFQQDKGLPVDKYLNVQTLEALGVSAF